MKTNKFINFLESLKGNNHDSLIEAIKKGYMVCFEVFDPKGPPIGMIKIYDTGDKYIAVLGVENPDGYYYAITHVKSDKPDPTLEELFLEGKTPHWELVDLNDSSLGDEISWSTVPQSYKIQFRQSIEKGKPYPILAKMKEEGKLKPYVEPSTKTTIPEKELV